MTTTASFRPNRRSECPEALENLAVDSGEAGVLRVGQSLGRCVRPRHRVVCPRVIAYHHGTMTRSLVLSRRALVPWLLLKPLFVSAGRCRRLMACCCCTCGNPASVSVPFCGLPHHHRRFSALTSLQLLPGIARMRLLTDSQTDRQTDRQMSIYRINFIRLSSVCHACACARHKKACSQHRPTGDLLSSPIRACTTCT